MSEARLLNNSIHLENATNTCRIRGKYAIFSAFYIVVTSCVFGTIGWFYATEFQEQRFHARQSATIDDVLIRSLSNENSSDFITLPKTAKLLLHLDDQSELLQDAITSAGPAPKPSNSLGIRNALSSFLLPNTSLAVEHTESPKTLSWSNVSAVKFSSVSNSLSDPRWSLETQSTSPEHATALNQAIFSAWIKAICDSGLTEAKELLNNATRTRDLAKSKLDEEVRIHASSEDTTAADENISPLSSSNSHENQSVQHAEVLKSLKTELENHAYDAAFASGMSLDAMDDTNLTTEWISTRTAHNIFRSLERKLSGYQLNYTDEHPLVVLAKEELGSSKADLENRVQNLLDKLDLKLTEVETTIEVRSSKQESKSIPESQDPNTTQHVVGNSVAEANTKSEKAFSGRNIDEISQLYRESNKRVEQLSQLLKTTQTSPLIAAVGPVRMRSSSDAWSPIKTVTLSVLVGSIFGLATLLLSRITSLLIVARDLPSLLNRQTMSLSETIRSILADGTLALNQTSSSPSSNITEIHRSNPRNEQGLSPKLQPENRFDSPSLTNADVDQAFLELAQLAQRNPSTPEEEQDVIQKIQELKSFIDATGIKPSKDVIAKQGWTKPRKRTTENSH